MSKCARCQGEVFPDDNFCGQCGHAMNTFGDKAGMTQQDLKSTDIRFNLGVVYFKMGKMGQAIEVFDQILAQDPDHREAQDYREQISSVLLGDSKSST